MNEDQFSELLERFHQGDLSEQELQELRDLILSDESLRREAGSDQWANRLLEYAMKHRLGDEEFLKGIRPQLSPREDEERFISKTVAQVMEQAPSEARKPKPQVLKWAVAAAILIGLAALMIPSHRFSA